MNPSYALWRDFHPIEKEDVRSVTSEGMSEQVVAVEDVGQVPARPFAWGEPSNRFPVVCNIDQPRTARGCIDTTKSVARISK